MESKEVWGVHEKRDATVAMSLVMVIVAALSWYISLFEGLGPEDLRGQLIVLGFMLLCGLLRITVLRKGPEDFEN